MLPIDAAHRPRHSGLMFLLLVFTLGCRDRVGDRPNPPVDDSPVHTGDSGEPVATVDVLVIGSGPAGLAAAWEAREAGASVLVLEMDEKAGGGGWYGAHFLGVDTRWQQDMGIEDSLALATEEWPSITAGGDAQDPWVQRLLSEGDATIAWLTDNFGAQVDTVVFDHTGGSVPRLHLVTLDGQPPIGGLVSALEAEIWTSCQATALRVVGDQVAGATFTDLRTGEEATIAAGATVVATGGFARDPERLAADRPDLDGALILFDIHPQATGAGIPLFEGVGARFTSAGRYGVYVHATSDYRPGLEREVLWMGSIFNTLVVDRTGQRVGNEEDLADFGFAKKLAEAPDKQLFALYPASIYAGVSGSFPAYNWSEPGVAEVLTGEEMVELGVVDKLDSETIAAYLGADTATIQATLARYDSFAAQHLDEDFGKSPEMLAPFGTGPIYAVPLFASAAKAFGGVALDPEARVLDADGQPIPGLYAAGEVAGMLGTEAVGEGFPGSITGVYLTGRVAGQQAAAFSR